MRTVEGHPVRVATHYAALWHALAAFAALWQCPVEASQAHFTFYLEDSATQRAILQILTDSSEESAKKSLHFSAHGAFLTPDDYHTNR
jgi:hypothetical protein